MTMGATRAKDAPGRRLAVAMCKAAHRQMAKADKLDDELAKLAIECFEGAEAAANWLIGPEISLGGKIPLTVALSGAKGREEVRTLILRIEHCIPT